MDVIRHIAAECRADGYYLAAVASLGIWTACCVASLAMDALGVLPPW